MTITKEDLDRWTTDPCTTTLDDVRRMVVALDETGNELEKLRSLTQNGRRCDECLENIIEHRTLLDVAAERDALRAKLVTDRKGAGGVESVTNFKDQIVEWRRLCAAATPGPWAQGCISPGGAPGIVSGQGVVQLRDGPNAAFICSARTALPQCLDALEETGAERDAMEQKCNDTFELLEEIRSDGQSFAARIAKQKNLIPCPTCKGKGMVSGGKKKV